MFGGVKGRGGGGWQRGRASSAENGRTELLLRLRTYFPTVQRGTSNWEEFGEAPGACRSDGKR